MTVRDELLKDFDKYLSATSWLTKSDKIYAIYFSKK